MGTRKFRAGVGAPLLQMVTAQEAPAGAGWVSMREVGASTAGDGVIFGAEAELDALLHAHPQMLPVERYRHDHQIASLGTQIRVPIGRGSGLVDNLFLTDGCGLVIVENKLWRNAEARRSVVSQLLEYASAFTQLTAEQFEQELRESPGSVLGDGGYDSLYSFYTACAGSPTAKSQGAFYDELERALQTGDFLLFIAGDGVHERAEKLASVVAQHPHLRFQMALLSISAYAVPGDESSGDRPNLLVPRVSAETRVIRRTEIRIDMSGDAAGVTPRIDVTVEAPDDEEESMVHTASTFRSELAEATSPTTARRIEDLLTRLQDEYAIEPVWTKSGVSLRMRDPHNSSRYFTVLFIKASGAAYLGWLHKVGKWGYPPQFADRYLRRVADLTGAEIKVETDSTQEFSVQALLDVDDDLLQAIHEFVESVRTSAPKEAPV